MALVGKGSFIIGLLIAVAGRLGYEADPISGRECPRCAACRTPTPATGMNTGAATSGPA